MSPLVQPGLHIPPPLPLPMLNFTPISLHPPHPSCAGRWEMRLTISSSHIISASSASSEGGLLTSFPCSYVRSLSWETVLHKLLQCGSFPWAAAFHELPQCGSFPWGTVFQEQAALPWVLHWITGPCQQTCSGRGSSLHGSAGPARSLLQHGLPMGSHPPSGTHLLWCGVPSTGYGWISAPPSTSMDCRGIACLIMVFIMSCKGRLCSGISNTSSPSFFTHLGVCRVVSFIVSFLSLDCPFTAGFFPLLKYVITEALPPSLIGLALASSRPILELTGIGSIRHGGSFSQFLTEATPIAPLLPKPCHANL